MVIGGELGSVKRHTEQVESERSGAGEVLERVAGSGGGGAWRARGGGGGDAVERELRLELAHARLEPDDALLAAAPAARLREHFLQRRRVRRLELHARAARVHALAELAHQQLTENRTTVIQCS